jgi:hypothetical protein
LVNSDPGRTGHVAWWQDDLNAPAERAAADFGRRSGKAAEAAATPSMRIARERGIGCASVRASSSRNVLTLPRLGRSCLPPRAAS